MKIKKAISPLIATILLIVVAVALIAIVVAWGKSFTTSNLADTANVVDTSCIGAAIQINNCEINDSNNLVFYIENTGNKTIYETDELVMHLTNTTSGTTRLNLSLSDYATLQDLVPGQMLQVIIDEAELPAGNPVIDKYNIKVISSYCPSDAVAEKANCN